MLTINTQTNEELIKYLTKIDGKLPSNEYLICITNTEEDLIVATKYNILPVTFDDDLYGPRTLSFSDAFRIFNLIRHKIIPETEKLKEVILHISCKDGITQAGAIAEWTAGYVNPDTLNKQFYENKNLFIDPSNITINKMFLVQMFFEQFIVPTENLPAVAANLLSSDTVTTTVKKNAEAYLNALFINETKLLVKRNEYKV